MRASTKTLLTLEEWAAWCGFHPWHFAQISRQADGSLFPQRNSQIAECRQASYQFPRQDFERLSREEIAIAIEQAESQFYRLTHFWPAPRYTEDELDFYPQNARRTTYAGWGNARGGLRTIRLQSKHVAAVGREVLTSLGTYAITRSDADGDGIEERVSIGPIVVPSGTLGAEICVFFTEADRLQLPIEEFEIRPVFPTISGVTLNIRSNSYCFVQPALQLQETAQPLAHDDPTTYVEEVEVFRRTTDYSQAGTLSWHWEGNCEGGPCTAAVSTPCFAIESSIDGFVTPRAASFDEATQQFVAAYPAIGRRAPDNVTCNYLSGYPRQRTTGLMDAQMKDIVCMLSASYIPEKTSMCKRADQRLEYYRLPPKEGERSPVNQRSFDRAPIGNSRGELDAWAKISLFPTMVEGIGG